MIHYTLLPEKEMRALRREYRIRVFVVLFFFISCGIVVGIGSLMPSYLSSYTSEKEAIEKVASIKQDRKVSGMDNLSKELNQSYELVKKLKTDEDSLIFSDIIKKIIGHRKSSISINSIQLSRIDDVLSSSEIILQGKSTTRDALLDFKKSLEADASISKIELPISDLAKSKDINFAIRIRIKK